ncbi:MAG: SIMPL domain-containing protein [Patescibacteria group bacterium]
MNSIFNSKLNQLLITLVLAGATIALIAFAYSTIKQQNQWGGPMTINVTGKGEVMAKPDIAQFSFSVRADGADATEAQKKSADAINAVTAYLKENAIEDKDIKTEGYNMNPKYKYEQKPCLYGSICPPGEQIPDGFEVFQTVTVKVRDIQKAGTLLGGVGDKGATDISGLNFTIDDEDALKAQAREMAIADAQANAEKLAGNLNVRIVKMMSYYEDSPAMPMYGYGGTMMDAQAKNAPMAAPEISVGENKTVSNVTITYEVK